MNCDSSLSINNRDINDKVETGSMTFPTEVLLLTRYERLGASSRLRFLQFLPDLERHGFHFTVAPLLSDDYVRALYAGRQRPIQGVARSYLRRLRALSLRRQFNLLWLEKEALPWMPLGLERAFIGNLPIVVDFVDAWFHRYDQNPNCLIRQVLGRKLDRLMGMASVVTAGNDYVAARASQAGTRRVVKIPTGVNIDKYSLPVRPRSSPRSRFIIGWIGTPITARYLNLIAPVLRELGPDFVLRIIGGGPVELPGVVTECVPWTEKTETEALQDCDVGVMPLSNGLWEQGKSGYKLIQYMATGLPVIASPVGANREIVNPGVTGFLAGDLAGWRDALLTLRASPSKAEAMGAAARKRAIERYSTQAILPILIDTLKHAAKP